MTHYCILEDADGEMVDRIELCSDSCHETWCRDNDEPYKGWHGCNEQETTSWCASCGVVLPGFKACECQMNNIVVNRLRVSNPELCEDHGNTIQCVIHV